MKPIAFFDRDGVINVDIGYLWRKEDFSWVEGAPEAIRYLNEHGWHVVVVTNQSGVARGYYQEAEVVSLHEWINDCLGAQGARIDAFYYCPHHTEGSVVPYAQECACRKPNPGMLLQAFADFSATRERSFLIGDKESDMQAAAAAGIPGYLYRQGNLNEIIQNIASSLQNRG